MLFTTEKLVRVEIKRLSSNCNFNLQIHVELIKIRTILDIFERINLVSSKNCGLSILRYMFYRLKPHLISFWLYTDSNC